MCACPTKRASYISSHHIEIDQSHQATNNTTSEKTEYRKTTKAIVMSSPRLTHKKIALRLHKKKRHPPHFARYPVLTVAFRCKAVVYPCIHIQGWRCTLLAVSTSELSEKFNRTAATNTANPSVVDECPALVGIDKVGDVVCGCTDLLATSEMPQRLSGYSI